MARATLSAAIQDYLREIYKLGESGDRVTTTALARGMGVSPGLNRITDRQCGT